jgi:ATP synthase F0 subunit b
VNINATLLGQAIAFFIFVVFCMKYVWPPLMAAIEARQKEIADGLSSAERAKKDLDLAKANATDQLKEAKLRLQIIEQANKRKAQIIDEAAVGAHSEREKSWLRAVPRSKLNVIVPKKNCASRLLLLPSLVQRRSWHAKSTRLPTATSSTNW